MKAEEIFFCRYCLGELETVLDLGLLYPSGFIKGDEVIEKEPLVLAKCSMCNLVQLKHNIDLDGLYRQYWYKSSLNKSMLRDLEDIVKQVEEIVDINDGDTLIDIGCNSGDLFDFYSNRNAFRIGFDPAYNLKEEAEKHCDIFINDYFPSKEHEISSGSVKVVTSIAMFYDLPDPNSFIEEIKRVLSFDGVWVIQLTDLYSMLKINAIDNICHEHLEYYTLNVLNDMLCDNELQIFDVSYNKVNGGSLRILVSHENAFPVSSEVYDYLVEESIYFSGFENPLESLKQRVDVEKEKLLELLKECKEKSVKVFVLGASTKGNTLLQYYGIDNTLIPYAMEVNSDKFGLKTVGSNIEIISEEKGFDLWANFLLVLPWHFRDFILEKQKEFLNSGIKYIFPLPHFEVVSGNPNTYISHGVAETVKSLFPENYKGICIDVGAYDPFWTSNSWIFEKDGWDVYCIDGNKNCIDKLNSNRKKVYHLACSNKNEDDANFYVYKFNFAGPVSSDEYIWKGEAAGTGLINHQGIESMLSEVQKVDVRTLDWFIENIIKKDKIDYLSIDVEGTELQVLQGVDLEKWKIKVVTVENVSESLTLRYYMKQKGYKFSSRVSVNDIFISERM